GQHLLAQLRAAHRDLLDLLQRPYQGRAVLARHPRQPSVAQDAGEQVVEVVGDAARQDAEAFQLLRLELLLLRGGLLGFLARGDVGQDAVDQPARGLVGRRGDNALAHPDETAVGAADAVLQPVGLSGGDTGHEVVPARQVLRGDDLFPAPRVFLEVAHRTARDPLHHRRQVAVAPLAVFAGLPTPQAVGNAGQHAAQLGLAAMHSAIGFRLLTAVAEPD